MAVDDATNVACAKPSEPAARETPIVAIGAGEGGLDPLKAVFRSLPERAPFAVVLVSELDPGDGTTLLEALGKEAPAWSVRVAADHERPEPGIAYVLPRKGALIIEKGELRGRPRTPGLTRPIDALFESLASERARQIAAVVLSGAGTDGCRGLVAVADVGGLTIAQHPSTASQSELPRAAMDTGVVEAALPPEAIMPRVDAFFRAGLARSAPVDEPDESLASLSWRVRESSGLDLDGYKPSNVLRRTLRRMRLRDVRSMADYLAILRTDPTEVEALRDDMLPHGSSFLAGGELRRGLWQSLFPALAAVPRATSAIRIWVAGCGTGEEPYSIAMGLTDYLEQRGRRITLQLFCTDVSSSAIDIARRGRYGSEAVARLPEEYVRRFLVPVRDGFEVSKALRSACVFAKHDLLSSPPLSRMDLVSCRNVLLHFRPEAQQRALSAFYYALKPSGFLLLGPADTVEPGNELFREADSRIQLFQRRVSGVPAASVASWIPTPAVRPARAPAEGAEVDRIALDRYAPPGFLVDQELRVLQFRGKSGAHIEPVSRASPSVLNDLIRADLRFPLMSAFHEAKQKNAPAIRAERREAGGQNAIEVLPLPATPGCEPHYLVSVLDLPPDAVGPPSVAAQPEGSASLLELDQARAEVESSRQQLRAATAELERANEELRSAQADLLSANEELSSVNDELYARNAELARANADLSNTLASVGVPTILLDSDLRIRTFSPAAVRVLGLDSSDVGRLLSDVPLPLGGDLHFVRLARAALEAGTEREEEARDASGRWWSIRTRPYKIGAKTDGAVLVLHDVHALKSQLLDAEAAKNAAEAISQQHAALLEATERARREAEGASRMKDEFLAVLSHELRAPLNAVSGWVQILAQEAASPNGLSSERVGRALEVIERNIALQGRIIEDLLDMSRIISGRFRMEQQDVDMLTMASSAVDALRPAAEKKGLSLTVESGPTQLFVAGDAARVQQALFNLVTNAIKFTDAGGTVTVRLRRRDGEAVVEVQDTGQGIEPAFLPKVFELFRQADSSTTRSSGGLGLGLAIVHHIAQAHGGSIEARSEGRGRGATFELRIPLAYERTAEAQGVPQGEGQPRILVLDDEDDAREMLVELLSLNGFNASPAASAAEALSRLGREHFDLLLSDIGLPVQDGYALIRSLRESERGAARHLAAIAVTGFAGLDDRDKALEAGFDAHVAKPPEVNQLVSLIRKLVALGPARARQEI